MLCAAYAFLLGYSDAVDLVKLVLLLVEGIVLNMLCQRHGILGVKSELPGFAFILLSALFVPLLSFSHLGYGIIFLGGFFLSYESREDGRRSLYYLIYIGIALAIAQASNNVSVLLLIPIFVLYLQSGPRRVRSFLISIVYFLMVLSCYIGVLYIIDLPELAFDLVPKLRFSRPDIAISWSILYVPFLVLSFGVHLLMLNRYSFRFPNKSKIINYTMVVQVFLGLIITWLTGEYSLLIYPLMALAILLSVGLRYTDKSAFANALLVSGVVLSLATVYLYSII